jgi:Holin of 3TMs, for gene-transfer release
MAFLGVIAGPILNLIGKVVDKVVPDANLRDTLKAQLAQQVLQEDFSLVQQQLEVNLQEAKSDRLFIAGWRPYVGWVCGTGLAYQILIQPFLAFLVGLYKWQTPPLPALDSATMMTVLMGLLGLGGMRTYEKINAANQTKTGA